MKLRNYQQKAVSKMLWSLTLEGNDIVSMAQGSGKSHVIAEFVNQYGKPVLILVPSKEILEQDLDKLSKLIDPSDIGVYSASMNSKEVKKITIGTIQSAYKHPEQFAHYDVVLIDECDLLDPKHFDGMYNKFFEAIEVKKVIGLSATPFRRAINYQRWGQQKWMVKSLTTTKMINRVRPKFWDRMLEVVNVKDLQEQGFLATLTYKDVSLVEHEDIPVNKSQSEFDLEAFENKVFNDYGSVAHFIQRARFSHQKCLVFCSSIRQAEKLQSMISRSVVVSATTPKKTRENAIQGFRDGTYNTLLGVNIFTVGFDVPDIDCIVVLRPTKSLRLWTQVLGRGTRLALGKETCTIYDFVGNVKALGTLESMEICKVDNKWNVKTSAYPSGMHGVNLFEYKLKDPATRKYFVKRDLLT